jgi:hypothetical protein
MIMPAATFGRGLDVLHFERQGTAAHSNSWVVPAALRNYLDRLNQLAIDYCVFSLSVGKDDIPMIEID